MPTWARNFVFGEFELDEARFELRHAGRPVKLRATPFRLLQHLIRERERVVPKRELLEAIWPDVLMSDTALSSALKDIRRALGDDGKEHRWIRTLRGRGVRFVGEVAAREAKPGRTASAPAPPPRRAEASVTTILFADLVASTARLQALGDERAQGLFEALHARMARVVDAHAGEELQWLGDGLMAAFDSAADAVRAAIALQRAVRQDADGERPGLRVGLNVGEALRQMSGSGYFGLPVIVASRLCDRAVAGQILASSLVAGLLAGRRAFCFRELGLVELKGVEAPVRICEVEYKAGEGAAALAGGTPFVGRAREIARLEAALERSEVGKGAVLFVTGEPGIGKTRLISEFVALARERGARVLSGRCFESEGAGPYASISEALDDYVAEADRVELLSDLGPYGSDLGVLAPRLRARLPDLPELPRLGREEDRTRLFYAISEFLLATARRAPLVLVLDDLHWADGATVALLRYLGRFAVKGSLLVVGGYRDAEVRRDHPLTIALAEMKREVEYERVALSGLERESVGRFLATLAEHEVGRGFSEFMTAETGGNPFFLRELFAHFLEARKVRGDEGTWTSDLSLGEIGVPEGVRQIIGRRLSRLSPVANRLLSAAAGFQGTFAFEIARRVVDLREAEALDALDEALEAQLARPAAGGGDRYEFAHDLIRGTLYAGLNPSRCARLHRRIAEEMEHAWGEETSEHSAEIARHYHQSREIAGAERGVVHALEAADVAERAAAQEEVVRSLQVVLDLLPKSDARRPRVLARQALALASILRAEEATTVGSEAAKLLAASEGPDAAADYLAELVQPLAVHGRARAFELAEQGLQNVGARRDATWAALAGLAEMARQAADPANPGINLDSPVWREITHVVCRDGSGSPGARRVWNSLAVASRGEALELAKGGLLVVQAGQLRSDLAVLSEEVMRAIGQGDLALAVASLSRTAAIRIALGDLTAAAGDIGRADAILGRMSEATYAYTALGVARAALAFATGEGLESLIPVGLALVERASPEQTLDRAALWGHLAAGYAHLGREREAIEALQRVVPGIAQAPGWAFNYTHLIHLAIETIWVLKRNDHVELLELNLREKTLAPDFRAPHADSRLSLARVCALQGRLEEATSWFTEARRVLEEQGARPLRAIADYDEALMDVRRGAPGDRERAEPRLDQAVAQFRAIGMPGWERRARRLLAPTQL